MSTCELRGCFKIRIFLLGGLFGLLVSSPVEAAPGGGGDTSPVLELGVNMHAGDTGKSITGSMGYVFGFRAEKKKTFFRPQAAANFEYAKGTATIGGSGLPFSLTDAAFAGGFYIFPFMVGRIQPFLGGSGIYAWHLLKLVGAPAGTEPNTQSMGFGYELMVGADLRMGSADGTAIRIEGGLWTVSGTLAGQSSFQLNGFKLMLGVVY